MTAAHDDVNNGAVTDRLRDWARELRLLATAVEQTDACGHGSHGVTVFRSFNIDSDNAAVLMAETARKIGGHWEKSVTDTDDGDFRLERKFGPHRLVLYTARGNVCERVVVGTETVTREVPDLEALAAVPTVTVTETVEQVEWVCPPSLHRMSATHRLTHRQRAGVRAHVTRVSSHAGPGPDGRTAFCSLVACSCGWVGQAHRTRAEAEADAARHREQRP